MKKFIKKSLILSSVGFPLIVVSCFQEEDLNKRVFSNPEATEKYQLLKEILSIPLSIEKNDIASFNFSTLIDKFSIDPNEKKVEGQPNFQRFFHKDSKETILKKIETLAKNPNFSETIKKYYLGTSYLSAKEFFEKWKASQQKYLKSTNLHVNPEFIPQEYGSGFSVNNQELEQRYLYYKTIIAFAKHYLKMGPVENEYPEQTPHETEKVPENEVNSTKQTPETNEDSAKKNGQEKYHDINSKYKSDLQKAETALEKASAELDKLLTEMPKRTASDEKGAKYLSEEYKIKFRDWEAKFNDAVKKREDAEQLVEKISASGQTDTKKIAPSQHSEQKTEKNKRLIPVPIDPVLYIVGAILDATTQPLSNAYWWNYNYEILNEAALKVKKGIKKGEELDLPIISDKDFQLKSELTEKLDKYSIKAKDGRKYKVQPRAFFLVDDKTYVDEQDNKIKKAIYRLYWIIDKNPDSSEKTEKKEPQTKKLTPENKMNNDSKSAKNHKFHEKARIFANSEKLANPETQQMQENNKTDETATETPKVQGPEPRPKTENTEEIIGLVDDFDKYKFTDKIQKSPFANSNNFSQGGLYNANLLQLEVEMKKQDPNNPNLFYVERRIDIKGFLKKGKLLPFQPANLENNLEILALNDKYNQILESERDLQNNLMINPNNLE
ncbi:hypothetical protein DR093_01955 [Mycoplasma flocculare]|uniref:hypothetical protein n=1 Tax=Mesomycoplasma flocculare TaxID=2128 RepID=UPI0013695347|nr:hypothetical protein [Mesomycoplasma flocculare]MXR12344.1 hypothetical protein [Mesomycoplasma flocculare]